MKQKTKMAIIGNILGVIFITIGGIVSFKAGKPPLPEDYPVGCAAGAMIMIFWRFGMKGIFYE